MTTGEYQDPGLPADLLDPLTAGQIFGDQPFTLATVQEAKRPGASWPAFQWDLNSFLPELIRDQEPLPVENTSQQENLGRGIPL